MATTFSNKTEILGSLFTSYQYDDYFREWAEYYNIGLPLAYLISKDFSTPTDSGTESINKTWASLLELIEIEDTGFEHISDIFTAGNVIISS
jgi:hypothetical protein